MKIRNDFLGNMAICKEGLCLLIKRLYMSRWCLKSVIWVNNRKESRSGLRMMPRSLLTDKQPVMDFNREIEMCKDKFMSTALERTDAFVYLRKLLSTSALRTKLCSVEWNFWEAYWEEILESVWWSGWLCGRCSCRYIMVCKSHEPQKWNHLEWTGNGGRWEAYAGENGVGALDERW